MIHLLLLNLTGVDSLQPGEYCVDVDDGMPQKAATITVACPLCGGKHVLNEAATVADSGRVNPMFKCPTCPLLEWVALSSWEIAKP